MVNEFIEEEERNGLFTLRGMLLQERADISQVYHELSLNNTINSFTSGHYHSSNTEIIFNTKFNHLGINEIRVF
jgi:hypothetical protein